MPLSASKRRRTVLSLTDGEVNKSISPSLDSPFGPDSTMYDRFSRDKSARHQLFAPPLQLQLDKHVASPSPSPSSLEPSPSPKDSRLDPKLFRPPFNREKSSSMALEGSEHSRSMVTVTTGRTLTLHKDPSNKNAKAREKRFKLGDLPDEQDRIKYKNLLEVVRMDYVQRGPDNSQHGVKGVSQLLRSPDYSASLDAFNVRYYSEQLFGPDALPMPQNQLDAVCSWSAF